jgi:3-deoxy-D-manno-octulosonic-acid transferase
MAITSWGYRAALRLGTAVAPILGRLNHKLRTGDQGRRAAGDRLLEWARWNRDSSRPLVWFHASSVGEGLQAESVMAELRRLRPDCQVMYTHFSASAEELGRRLAVDVADYLPYDLPHSIQRLLASLEPALLVFSKLDVWPELATRAATTGIPVTMVAATVSPGSTRLRWPARSFLRPGYQVIAAAAAISAEDAERLARLGVPRDRIEIVGDPRFDSVSQRVEAVTPGDRLLHLGENAPTLVAGSTWPADETVLLGAFAQLYQRHPARLILVPHEPTPEHLELVEEKARALKIPVERLSEATGASPLILVDRTGVLSVVYGSGAMAYVGGGFGGAGLHSVLEPAAWGIPVAFGPRWQNSRDARLLLEAGGGTALPLGRRAAIESLHKQWENWIADEGNRRAQGQRARGVVDRGLGAARRSAELLTRFISARPLQRSPRAEQSDRLSGL